MIIRWSKILDICFFFIFLLMWQNVSGHIQKAQHSLGFDAQNAFVWQWTASKGILPYRDVFYPYGLLTYFQNVSPIGNFVSVILVSFTLTITWRGIVRGVRSSRISVVALVFFLVFLVRYIGIETWSRYGIGIAACFLLAQASIQTARKSILWGMVAGALFGLVFDQTFYVVILFALHAVICGRKSIRNLFTPIGIFSLGFCIGNIPFLIYLLYTHSLQGFWYFLQYLPHIATYAKTPFIPFALSPSNTFSFVVLFSCLLALSYWLILRREQQSISTRVIFFLTSFIVLLEQKSIIRSIDWQIVLPAIVIFLFTVLRFMERTKARGGVWGIGYQVALFFLCAYLLFAYPFRFVFGNNLITRTDGSLYENVLRVIRGDGGGKVFSYPADPMYYVLFDQLPPYFFTGYEATPRMAQQKIITYLRDMPVEYILFDTNKPSVQDGVPNEARNGYELAYISSNYHIWKYIGQYRILKRNSMP